MQPSAFACLELDLVVCVSSSLNCEVNLRPTSLERLGSHTIVLACLMVEIGEKLPTSNCRWFLLVLVAMETYCQSVLDVASVSYFETGTKI